MVLAFAIGVYDVVQLMRETVLLDSSARQLIFKTLNTDFLHNIAILIVLMKAYRILVEYMRHHHIDLKYMVEITIIACVLELLFNFQHYTEDMRLVLLGLGVTFLGIYAFRYDVLVKSSISTQQHSINAIPVATENIVVSNLQTDKPKTKKRSSTKVK